MATFHIDNWNPEYLEGEDPERVRLIGVEFEGRIKQADKIKDDGLKFLDEDTLSSELTWERNSMMYKDKDGNLWEKSKYLLKKLKDAGVEVAGIGYDGGGKEFATFPDSYGAYLKGGTDRLNKVINMLTSATDADKMSGTHINVSKLNTDTKTTWNNIYWFMMCFGPQLQKIFGRRSHWAKTPLPKDYYSRTDDHMTKHILFEAPTKRPEVEWVYAKGSMVVDKGNRYEFRGPKATHNINEVLAWVQICNNIVELCANGYIKEMPFAEVLKGKYIRAYLNEISKNPDREITAKERAMRISDIGYVKITDGNDKIL